MPDVKLQILRGKTANLPGKKNDGRLLFTTDNAHIYMDNGTDRIEFYREDIDRSTCHNYSLTIHPSDWRVEGTMYSFSYGNTSLRANHPPIITCTNADKSEYSLITSAVATTGVGIEFMISKLPSADISLIIIDLG